MIDDSRLMMYKFILSHFNDFVIYEAFCQRMTYVLDVHINLYISFSASSVKVNGLITTGKASFNT